MGTNYYMITKNKDIAHKYFAELCDFGGKYPEILNKEYTLEELPEYRYVIHLNKLSWGWRPLFERHDKAFTTFQELEKFVDDHKDDLVFEDEYGEVYTFDEYKQHIIDHAGRKPEPMKWEYVEDRWSGRSGHKCLQTVECEPDEADLWLPFNHKEYSVTQEKAQQKYGVWEHHAFFKEGDRYFEDPDYPVDWVYGDFS